MILTPIPAEHLDAALDQFAAQVVDPAARVAFARIRATSRERACGETAELHRREALALARACGMTVHPPGARPGFNWDGAALDGDTEAYVILHEIAHFLLAPPERRRLPDFGLGPGPDTTERAAAERAAAASLLEREMDEAAASLLGILWEAALGQPALASFLDQNWLEGLERSAAAHFTAVYKQVAGARSRSSCPGKESRIVSPQCGRCGRVNAGNCAQSSTRHRIRARLHAGSVAGSRRVGPSSRRRAPASGFAALPREADARELLFGDDHNRPRVADGSQTHADRRGVPACAPRSAARWREPPLNPLHVTTV